jgi:Mor family transcriptional regulator
MDNLNWMDELDNVESYLSDDLKFLFKIVGYENFKTLYQYFMNDGLQFSKQGLSKLKSAYIKKMYDGTNLKEIKRTTQISQTTIYRIMRSHYDDR